MDFKKFLNDRHRRRHRRERDRLRGARQPAGDFYAHPPSRQDVRMGWMVLSDFVAGFVFSWFYLAVAAVRARVPGGATMGFYTGVLVIFPAAILMHLMCEGFPYYSSWIWIFYGIAWTSAPGRLRVRSTRGDASPRLGRGTKRRGGRVFRPGDGGPARVMEAGSSDPADTRLGSCCCSQHHDSPAPSRSRRL